MMMKKKMKMMLTKYLEILQKKTNKELLAWQFFNFLKYSSVILTAMLMARLIPSLELIKSYEHILLLSSIVSFFFVSGLGQTVIPFYETQQPTDQGSLFKTLFFLLLLLSSLSALFLILYDYFFSEKPSLQYLLYGAVLIFNTPCFALENYYLVHKKSPHLLIWAASSYSLQVLSFILPLFFFKSLEAGFCGLLIAAVLKFVFTCSQLKVFESLLQVKSQMTQFIVYSWPVVFSFVIGGSYTYLNALLVEDNLSSKDFILYRYGAREFPLFLIIANSFSLVYSAKIAQGIKTKQVHESLLAFKSKSRTVMHQLFPLAVVLMLSSQFLFSVFYTQAFVNAFVVFNLMLFLILSRMLFPQTILLGYGHGKYFLYSSLTELIVGVSLSLILVQSHGLIGVSVAMIVAFTVEKLVLIVICYYHKINFFKYLPIRVYLGYCGLLLLSFIFSIS